VINTNLPPILGYTVPWLIICQMFASESGVPHFNALAGGYPVPVSPYVIYRQKLDFSAYISAAESIGVYSTTYVTRPESYRIRWNYAAGYFAVQGHARSPSLLPIESSHATSY